MELHLFRREQNEITFVLERARINAALQQCLDIEMLPYEAYPVGAIIMIIMIIMNIIIIIIITRAGSVPCGPGAPSASPRRLLQ